MPYKSINVHKSSLGESNTKQLLIFEVYDVDNEKELDNLGKQQFLGRVEIDLGEIIIHGNGSKDFYLIGANKKKTNAKIKIKATEADIGSSKYTFKISLQDFITKNNIFFTISSIIDSSFIIYKSNIMKRSNN